MGGFRAQASNVALGGTHTAGRSTSRMGESRGKTTAGSRSWPACTASNSPMDVAAGRPVGASSDPSMRAGCTASQVLETSASPSSEKSGTHTILRCPESEFAADADGMSLIARRDLTRAATALVSPSRSNLRSAADLHLCRVWEVSNRSRASCQKSSEYDTTVQSGASPRRGLRWALGVQPHTYTWCQWHPLWHLPVADVQFWSPAFMRSFLRTCQPKRLLQRLRAKIAV